MNYKPKRLKPIADVSAVGSWAVSGAATRHAALAKYSDDEAKVRLSNALVGDQFIQRLEVPRGAGDYPGSHRIRIRARATSGTIQIRCRLYDKDPATGGVSRGQSSHTARVAEGWTSFEIDVAPDTRLTQEAYKNLHLGIQVRSEGAVEVSELEVSVPFRTLMTRDAPDVFNVLLPVLLSDGTEGEAVYTNEWRDSSDRPVDVAAWGKPSYQPEPGVQYP